MRLALWVILVGSILLPYLERDLAPVALLFPIVPGALSAFWVARSVISESDREEEEQEEKDLVSPIFWRSVGDILVSLLALQAVAAGLPALTTVDALMLAMLLSVPSALFALVGCYVGVLMAASRPGAWGAAVVACLGNGVFLFATFFLLDLRRGQYVLLMPAILLIAIIALRIFAKISQGGRTGKSLPVTLSGVALAFWSVVFLSFAFGRGHHRGGTLTACKSNLKNMGTAMEMYSTDWSGKYPPDVASVGHYLTPNYLKTIPECPSAGEVTYQFQLGPNAPYNTRHYQDFYFIECHGENHTNVSVPSNYPQYNGIIGLIER